MINRQTLRVIEHDILSALTEVEAKHNVKIKFTGGTFDRAGRFANMKLEIAAVGTDGNVESKEAATYKQLCGSYQLQPEWLGKTYKFRGHTYTVTGLNPRSYKFPVLVERADGKLFKHPTHIVANGFGVKVTPHSDFALYG
jgi:hypothetical protein